MRVHFNFTAYTRRDGGIRRGVRGEKFCVQKKVYLNAAAAAAEVHAVVCGRVFHTTRTDGVGKYALTHTMCIFIPFYISSPPPQLYITSHVHNNHSCALARVFYRALLSSSLIFFVSHYEFR